MAKWDDFLNTFGWTPRRKILLTGLQAAIKALAYAGCQKIYIDGSFVTQKENPNDYDSCWEIAGVDPNKLDGVFLDFNNKRLAQKIKYGGEFFPANLTENGSGKTFLDFFQIDKETGRPKGIIGLSLNGGSHD